MKQRWFEGIENEADKEAIRYEFEKSVKARQRLAVMLEKEIQTLVINMTSEEHFDRDWALLQADRVAQIKAYRKIMGLLE